MTSGQMTGRAAFPQELHSPGRRSVALAATRASIPAFLLAIAAGCSTGQGNVCLPVGQASTIAVSGDGEYISWREHIIDDEVESGVPLTGGDGLQLADLDRDGHEDVISVHESDSEYDDVGDGYVRVAFGNGGAGPWQNRTLADGALAGAPEDIAVGDLNGDGWPDLVIASELAHLLYLENPGAGARTQVWAYHIVAITQGRGSWIRVFIEDIDGDGALEVIAANKGIQNPTEPTSSLTPISIFEVNGDPMNPASWHETELGQFQLPHNARPVDIDADGDLDIIAGLRGTTEIGLFVNEENRFDFHVLDIEGTRANAFHVEFHDFNSDGRIDMLAATTRGLAWFEQPAELTEPWIAHHVGDFGPDRIAGMAIADIDGDGDVDIVAGGYSDGPRDRDELGDPVVAMGRIGWFENAGEGVFVRHDVSRRRRGMFDEFVARDIDNDGDMDFFTTRGNSEPYDGLIWLEQVRTPQPRQNFERARATDSPEQALCLSPGQ